MEKWDCARVLSDSPFFLWYSIKRGWRRMKGFLTFWPLWYTDCFAFHALAILKHLKSAHFSTKNGYFSVFCGSISHAFSCKHETHVLLTLVSFYCSFPSSPAQRLYKNLSPFIFTGHHFPVQPTAYCFAQLKQGTCLILVKRIFAIRFATCS